MAKKYNVLTGLVHSYCKPYRTDSWIKAIFALIWRRIRFGRGWISIDNQWLNEKHLKKEG